MAKSESDLGPVPGADVARAPLVIGERSGLPHILISVLMIAATVTINAHLFHKLTANILVW